MVRTQPFHGCNDRFESGADLQLWDIAKWVKAPALEAGIAGSNPAIPAMMRYSRGLRGQSAKLLSRRFESGPHLHGAIV